MEDQIQIRGFILLLFCGVLPEEKVRRQPFRLDIDLEVDITRPAETDDLTDTVNYGEVLDTLTTVLESERFDLLERLAGRTAELLLADQRVRAVNISAHKLRPPVPQNVTSTGVQIRRER